MAISSQFGHMQVNVHPANISFYKDLFSFLGWHVLYEEANTMLGLASAGGPSIWFTAAPKETPNDYDGVGVNHLAIQTTAQADVDATAAFLAERSIPALFETPRHRAEFSAGDGKTYYQVMFETPDRLLIEVVYEGPKA